uniref:Protein BTG1 n=1 Tax=Aquila chrysaetos chrysaetos TaxID=223781 RepID=A0A663FCD0_AQUCH
MHPALYTRASMIREIAAAVGFISKFLRTKGLMNERQLQTFSQSLQELLAEHYKHHWFPEKPCKGSGYRCIRINHKMDPLIGQAAQRIGLSSQELFQLLPSELTLWVDPYEVSYRIGEDGSICVLYEAAPAGDILKSSVDFLSCKTSAEPFQQLYFMFQKHVKKIQFFKEKQERSGSTMERWKKNTKLLPVFPRAARKSQIQSPFSFLPRQSHATVAVWVAPNQLAEKSVHLTATRDGEGELERTALSGAAAFGQAAIWPWVCSCPRRGSDSTAATREPAGGQKALGATSSAAAPLQRDDESRFCFRQVRNQA